MTLELKSPDEQPQDQDDLPLSIIDIQTFHEQLEIFIERKVAALRAQFPGLPPGTIRQTLVKGECLCRVVMRLLKEPQ